MLVGPPQTARRPEEARGVVLPAPLKSRTGLGNCSSKGPAAILAGLSGDGGDGFEDLLAGIYLAPSLDFSGLDQEGAVARIQEASRAYLEQRLFVLLIGGEHTVTLGATRALQEQGQRFGVVYFDAHADLKSGIGPIRLTHATVARRLVERGIPVAGLGWRSFDAREYEFWRRNSIKVCPCDRLRNDPRALNRLLENLPERVYLSIDVDVLDPAIMPSTGAPEPDGLSLGVLDSVVKRIFEQRRVIGADLVELSPRPDRPRPNLLAAWLGLKVLKRGLAQTGVDSIQTGADPDAPGVIPLVRPEPQGIESLVDRSRSGEGR